MREIVSTAKYLKYSLCRGNTQCAIDSLGGATNTSPENHPIEKYLNTAEIKDNKLRLPSLNQNMLSVNDSLATSNDSLPKLEYVSANDTERDSD